MINNTDSGENNNDLLIEIYKKFSARIFNFALSAVGNSTDAQDILQNTFLRILEYKTKIDPGGNIESYLFTIARNLIYNHLKERLYSNIIFGENIELSDPESPENILFFKNRKKEIGEIIKKLPIRRRQILIMRKIDNLSYKEISDKLKISENTVDTQLRRAMKFLKDRIDIKDFTIFILFLAIESEHFY